MGESAFRKMSETAKQNWCCGKYKSNMSCLKPLTSKNALISDYTSVNNLNNEIINNLLKSVNFMSEKFYSFSKQLQELVITTHNI